MLSGASTQVAPHRAMLNKSNVERSNPSGEGQTIRSAAPIPNSAADQRTNAATARCDSTTPLGRPVEPEVNRMTAASSSLRSGKGGAADGAVPCPPASRTSPSATSKISRAPQSATTVATRSAGHRGWIGT
ncbi:MAG: hypothetical protein ABSH46_18805 [Bryobacteraceae bacterium]